MSECMHSMCEALDLAPTPKTLERNRFKYLFALQKDAQLLIITTDLPFNREQLSCYLSPKGSIREGGALYSMRPLEIFFFSFGI